MPLPSIGMPATIVGCSMSHTPVEYDLPPSMGHAPPQYAGCSPGVWAGGRGGGKLQLYMTLAKLFEGG